MKYDELIGKSTGFRKIAYNWRDMALYALGVGAKKEDLMYTFEKNMKALPTFGTLPLFSAVNNEPQHPLPDPAINFVYRYLEKELGSEALSLHLSLEYRYHRPLYPIKGTLVFEDVVSGVYDWGDKGLIIETKMPVYDESGQLVCENISRNGYFAGGNFGGPKAPKSDVKIPDRAPDFEEEDYITPVQNVLYRLSGDTNLPHVDPEEAAKYGQPWAFMQGLCSYGFSCRLLIKNLIPGEPDRVKGMNAQMRSIVLPDTKIKIQGWKIEEGKAFFRLVNLKTGKAILDNGSFEWD